MAEMMKDGGPAFPFTTQEPTPGGYGGGTVQRVYSGATLRDYFAAKALAGFLASLSVDVEPGEHASGIARDCYALADAMLRERAK